MFFKKVLKRFFERKLIKKKLSENMEAMDSLKRIASKEGTMFSVFMFRLIDLKDERRKLQDQLGKYFWRF